MSRFITYLALDQMAALSSRQVIDAFRQAAGSAPMRIEPVGPDRDKAGEAIVVQVNGAPATVMFIDQPLPADAWQEAAARSLTWREAGTAMAATRAHVIVALLNDTTEHDAALNGAVAVSMLAGALAQRLPVAAAIFTEAQTIIPGSEAARIATALGQGQLPVHFLVGLSYLRGPALHDGRPTMAAMTTGLLPFVGRELELTPTALQPVEIAQRLLGLSQYLIVQGPVIKDGETVGLTEREKIRVRYAAAGQRGGVPVMLMTLETQDPATPRPGGAPARPTFGKRGL